MKIVMITPDAFMIDRRILLEAKTLINAGHQVTLLAGFECHEEQEYILDDIEIYRYKYDWDDERLKRIRNKLPNNDKLKMFINRTFMLVAKKVFHLNSFEMFMVSKLNVFDADVIHVHDLPCLKVGAYVANKKGIPLIYDAHEIYYAQDVLSKKQQGFYFKYEKNNIKKAAQVITVNPFIAKLMAERYNMPEPNVILNCTELPSNFNVYNRIIRDRVSIPQNWKIVLYQGWISAERNIETLIRGVKYFPKDSCLAILGYGEYEKTLREIAELEGIQDKVFFLGQVPSDEMLNFSVGADLGVIPYKAIDDNHLYCSPNKLFEYILAGLPIISNKLPFFELIANEYQCISMTDMDSPEIFGRHVAILLEDSVKLENLRNNCKKAAAKLNWHEEGKKLLEIYRTVC